MSENIFDLLRSTRESNNDSIEVASEELKVKPEYLRAIEQGRIDDISSKVYVYGYIRNYANWLGLDAEDVSAQFKMSQEKVISPELTIPSSGLNYMDYLALMPNRKIYLISFIMLVIVYFLWSINRPNIKITPVYSLTSLSEDKSLPIVEQKNKFLLEGNSFVLVASQKVNIKIIDNSTKKEKESKFTLNKGDVLFLVYKKGLNIIADNHNYVDVFLDGEKNTFLGKLNDVF